MTGDHQLVREMFRRDDTNTRCEDKELASYMEKLRGTLNLGIVNGVGKKWQEQSRFMTTALREFGFGKGRYLCDVHKIFKNLDPYRYYFP